MAIKNYKKRKENLKLQKRENISSIINLKLIIQL